VSTRTEKEEVNSFVNMIMLPNWGDVTTRRHLQRGTLLGNLQCEEGFSAALFGNVTAKTTLIFE
jgi:hypothetical protein